MANIIDRFLNSMKLYDDDDDDDDYDDYESEEEETPSRSSSRRRKAETETPAAAASFSASAASSSRRSGSSDREKSRSRRSMDNVVPMPRNGQMEVCMVKPTELDDAREICDILLSGRAVVINMEGVHVDLAQRIVDFTSGSCYSIKGNLQKISKYIFIVSPHEISLSGDFQEALEGSQDLSTLSLNS